MIEPQNDQGQRGVISEQHGLARLTSTLESLSQGQAHQRTRDTYIQDLLATLVREQDTLVQSITRLTRRSRQLVLAVLGLGVLTLGLGGWQVWHPPEIAYARAIGAVDAALVQQWNAMPKATQDTLSATYSRLGLPSPGERQRK